MILVHIYFRPGMDMKAPQWHQQILDQGSKIQGLVAKAASMETKDVIILDATQVWPLTKGFPNVLVRIDPSIGLPASVRDALMGQLGQIRCQLGKLPGFSEPDVTCMVC